MVDLSTIKRCADITESHVIQAARTRDDMRSLLLHAAKVSRPGEGASKVLLALARMAMSSSDWVEGDLRADLIAHGERTDVDVKAVSAGVVERVFPTFTLDAPLEEFSRAVRLVPKMIEPLTMHAQTDDHLVFVSTEDLYEEPPPESVEIGEAENDFGSLNIVIGEAVPESEIEKPMLKGATRPAIDPGDIHRRKTVERMPAIGRDALRSDLPPPSKRGEPPTRRAEPAPASKRGEPAPPSKRAEPPPAPAKDGEAKADDLDGEWD